VRRATRPVRAARAFARAARTIFYF